MNTHDIELPPLPPPFKKAVYATSANTKSVRDGVEMGGYEKEPPLFDDAQMHEHALAAIEADRKRTADLLKNPIHVHANMCRGIIAPITFDQLAHVLGDEATEAWLADRKRRGEDQHPFGYFRAGPFGWTDCAATDDGAIALYERPQAQGEPVGYVMPTAIKQLKAGGNAIVGGVSQGGDIPLYLAPQPAEPVSAPKHLIVRLQKHCEDKSNTAFARSTMREALQYLTAESSVSDKTACGSANGDCDSQPAEPVRVVSDLPVTEQEEEAWQQMEKTNE